MSAGGPSRSLPDNEARRQAALDAYAVVDTPPEQAFDDIVRLAVTLCGVQVAAIGLLDHDRFWFKAQWGLEVVEIPRAQAISDRVVCAGRTLVIDDLAADGDQAPSPLRAGGQPLRFFAGVPLLSPDGLALGTVCVADPTPRSLNARQLEGLEVLARQTSHLLELRRYALEQRQLLFEREALAQRIERSRADLQRRHEQLQKSASRDELTGLLNRSALVQLRNDPEAVRKLQQQAYSLVVIDVDLFKQVNDRHGHLLGDRALREVADAVTASVREGDLAVRYGGEEFLVVLPGTGLANAVEVAHRIRLRVAEASLPFPLTISAGVAAGDGARDSPERVFERADQALYRAKASGRNRVIADDTPRL